MELIFLAKNIANTAFQYFLAVFAMQICGIEPKFFPAYIIVALAPFLCYIIEGMGKEKLRLLPLLLLPLGFFFAGSWLEALALAITMVYAVAVVKKGRYHDEYGELFDSFRKNILFMLLTGGLGVVFGVILDFSTTVMPYILIYLIASVTELSMLRHSSETLKEKRFKLFNAAMLSSTCLLGFGMSSKAFLAVVAFVGSWLYKLIVMPILVIVGGISTVVAYVFMWIVFGNANFDGVNLELGEMAYGEANQIETIAASTNELLYRVIVAVILIAVAVFFIRKFLKKAQDAKIVSRNETRQNIKQQFSKTKSKEDKDSVRTTYRKFLNYLTKRNMLVRSCDTTLEIQNRITHEADKTLAAKLRQIYIAVRYNDRPSTKEEAEEAKNLYSELKKQHNK